MERGNNAMAKKEPTAFIKTKPEQPKLMYVRIDAALQITNRESYDEIFELLESILASMRCDGTAEIVEIYEIVNTMRNANDIINELCQKGDHSGEESIGW